MSCLENMDPSSLALVLHYFYQGFPWILVFFISLVFSFLFFHLTMKISHIVAVMVGGWTNFYDEGGSAYGFSMCGMVSFGGGCSLCGLA